MQIYLLFPVIRWVLKKTERYHAWLFGVALAYQVWLTSGCTTTGTARDLAPRSG